MRSGIVAPRSEDGRSSARGLKPQGSGLRAIDQSIVLAQVSDLLTAGAPGLSPAALLTAVSEAAAAHLSLINVVFFKRLAGQSRTLVWSASGVAAWSRMAAREQAWKMAAAFIDERPMPAREHDSKVASVSIAEERLGLSAMLYVESLRRLDDHDQRLLEELLRRMLFLLGSREVRAEESSA